MVRGWFLIGSLQSIAPPLFIGLTNVPFCLAGLQIYCLKAFGAQCLKKKTCIGLAVADSLVNQMTA
jgi:hypothetical protein